MCYSPKQETKEITSNENKVIDSIKIYTEPSKLENKYLNFNSPNAINRIASIENDYFNDYKLNLSKYYGTQWYNYTGQIHNIYIQCSLSVFFAN